ncbi:hypothetical protein niasHT_030410 [Heterodera trifolii]|uniref:Cytochrome P450 monooxygenase n=1 Tax=Heterodera trifolii TaxID=157864 RepID=A0ABD2JQA4_9BILA
MIVISLFISSLIALSFYNFYYKRRNFPPGPTPLPIFGNLIAIHLSGAGELAFKKWAKEFGPIYTYWIGELPVICVADYEQMAQIFQKDAENYANRYIFPIQRMAPTPPFRTSRAARFWAGKEFDAAESERKKEGGKQCCTPGLLQIFEELKAMFAKIDLSIDRSENNEINLAEFVEHSIASIVNQFLFGVKFDEKNAADFYEIKQMMDEHSGEVGGHSLFWMYILWPDLLRNVPWFRGKRLQLEERVANFHRYFEKRIFERQAKMENPINLEKPSSDYVEAYLKEKAWRDAAGENGHQFESTYQLGMMCFDLWITGQETVVSVLSWGIALLLNNGEPLAKMCEEIDQLISSETVTEGRRRMITVADKAHLPYTCAVTNEILRCANIAPQNFIRSVATDVRLANGFVLRRGTCILPQISVVLCDERVFPEPEKFNPDRFLDGNGKLRRYDQLIPFSIGKSGTFADGHLRTDICGRTLADGHLRTDICGQFWEKI